MPNEVAQIATLVLMYEILWHLELSCVVCYKSFFKGLCSFPHTNTNFTSFLHKIISQAAEVKALYNFNQAQLFRESALT